MERNFFIVGNPASGKNKLSQILRDFQAFLSSKNINHHFQETSIDGHSQVLNQLTENHTDLVIIGGDGTLNQTINALNKRIPVSIIPAGTGNDFAKNITIGKSLRKQFETTIHGTVKTIDLGECNGRKFLNGVGIGFDGQIVEDMASKRVPLLSGHAAYYYHVLRILASYRERPFDYLLDDKPFNKDLILLTIANGTTFGGGFKLTPNAKIDDGRLDVCEIGKFSALKRFANIHRLSSGSHHKLNAVKLHQTESVRIEANSHLFAHIDGEPMGQPPFDIKVLPGALELRVANQ